MACEAMRCGWEALGQPNAPRCPPGCSLTSRAKGSLRISRLVLRWYLRISRSATVPGRKRCGFSAARAIGGSSADAVHGLRTHHTDAAIRSAPKNHAVGSCTGISSGLQQPAPAGRQRRRPPLFALTDCCRLHGLGGRLALLGQRLGGAPLGRALQRGGASGSSWGGGGARDVRLLERAVHGCWIAGRSAPAWPV